MTASSQAGTPGFSSRTGTGACSLTRRRTATAVSPEKGGMPVHMA